MPCARKHGLRLVNLASWEALSEERRLREFARCPQLERHWLQWRARDKADRSPLSVVFLPSLLERFVNVCVDTDA